MELARKEYGVVFRRAYQDMIERYDNFDVYHKGSVVSIRQIDKNLMSPSTSAYSLLLSFLVQFTLLQVSFEGEQAQKNLQSRFAVSTEKEVEGFLRNTYQRTCVHHHSDVLLHIRDGIERCEIDLERYLKDIRDITHVQRTQKLMEFGTTRKDTDHELSWRNPLFLKNPPHENFDEGVPGGSFSQQHKA